MLNSILMLGSTLNKNKKINTCCVLLWLSLMLGGSNMKTGMMFIVLNLVSFGVVFALSKLIKGRLSNTIFAVVSILVWSVVMDVLCYVFAPQFVMGQTMIAYVMNGVLFNFRFCGMNVAVIGASHIVKMILNKKFNVTAKEEVVNY